MQGKKSIICAVLIGFMLLAGAPAPAADPPPDMRSEFAFTPRVWLSTVNPLAGVATVKEAYLMPTYGGTLSFRPWGSPAYSLEFTALYGSGEGDAVFPGGTLSTTSNGIPFVMSSVASTGLSEGERTDFEFMVRRNFARKWFSLHLGVRYATWREATAAGIGYDYTVGPILGQTISESETAEIGIDFESDYYALEGGFGTVSRLSDDGRHCLTSDVTLAAVMTSWSATVTMSENQVPAATLLEFLGYPDDYLEGDYFGAGLDVTAGYGYHNDRYGFSVNYHIVVLAEENVLSLSQLTALSGPEAAISIIF